MCSREFCRDCDEERIHRDHRKHYESASGLGQIVHRNAGHRAVTFVVGDIDLYVYKIRSGVELLRFVEHKQPRQGTGWGQQRVLDRLDEIIGFAVAHGFRLHPHSGVYQMRGHIDAATSGRRETLLAGVQTVRNGRLGLEYELADESSLHRWCDGDPSMVVWP